MSGADGFAFNWEENLETFFPTPKKNSICVLHIIIYPLL